MHLKVCCQKCSVFSPSDKATLSVTLRVGSDGLRSLHRVPAKTFCAIYRTPCHGRVYDALPRESRVAHAQLLQPKDPKQRKACVLHLAGTGDHTWNRRMNLGGPLVQKV